MKTTLLILPTTAWIASWTGIALGHSGGQAPTSSVTAPAVVAIQR